MIKPDGVRRGLIGEIISTFERNGFYLQRLRKVTPTRNILLNHYQEHAGKEFFERLIEFMLSGDVVIMEWVGSIEMARNIIGSTDPLDANPESLRGKYCNILPENLIHCSDSPESAQSEIDLWFNWV